MKKRSYRNKKKEITNYFGMAVIVAGIIAGVLALVFLPGGRETKVVESVLLLLLIAYAVAIAVLSR